LFSKKNGLTAFCDEQMKPLTRFKYSEVGESVPEEWREANQNKLGFGRWVAVGKVGDDGWEVLDENGKACKTQF
jgi:hypothetical protein